MTWAWLSLLELGTGLSRRAGEGSGASWLVAWPRGGWFPHHYTETNCPGSCFGSFGRDSPGVGGGGLPDCRTQGRALPGRWGRNLPPGAGRATRSLGNKPGQAQAAALITCEGLLS